MGKYEFTGETKQTGILENITVKRVRATADFGEVKAGNLGGWIEKEENLSQDGNAWVYGDAEVYGDAKVWGDAEVCDNAKVYGNAKVWGDAEVYDNAEVYKKNHVLIVGPVGSRNNFTTFYRNKNGSITVKCGCFLGEISKFLEKVEQMHGDTNHAVVYRLAAEIAKAQIGTIKELWEGLSK